jgi:hypothetical protein
MPTHLLLPRAGLNCMVWQTRPYYRYLPALRVHHLPGNHWPHLVKPEALNATMAAILSTDPLGTSSPLA